MPGCLGARMTGAGFGGCTVNLVQAEMAVSFAQRVANDYREQLGIAPEVYVCQASQGAGELAAVTMT